MYLKNTNSVLPASVISLPMLSFGVTNHTSQEFQIFFPLWFGFVQEASKRWPLNYGPKLKEPP